MKKILTLLGSLTLSVSTTASTAACFPKPIKIDTKLLNEYMQQSMEIFESYLKACLKVQINKELFEAIQKNRSSLTEDEIALIKNSDDAQQLFQLEVSYTEITYLFFQEYKKIFLIGPGNDELALEELIELIDYYLAYPAILSEETITFIQAVKAKY